MATRKSIIVEFMGFLLILAPLHPLYAQKGEECSYMLEVETSWLAINPRTGDHVRVRFGDKPFDEKNKEEEVLERHLSEVVKEQERKKPFQRGKTDKFEVNGPCLDRNICYLFFKVEGEDDWHVGDVTVYSQNGNDTFHLHKKITKKAWDGRDHCEFDPMLASEQGLGNAYQHDDSSDTHKNKHGKSRKNRKGL